MGNCLSSNRMLQAEAMIKWHHYIGFTIVLLIFYILWYSYPPKTNLEIKPKENTNTKWKDLLRCQADRIEYLKEQCLKYNLVSDLGDYDVKLLRNMTYKMIIDDSHKVVLRAIQKSGCSSWKTLLINNRMHSHDVINPHDWRLISSTYGLKLFTDRDKDYIVSTLEDYFSLLTVRHPLARLESAFKDVDIRRKHRVHVNDSEIARLFEKRLETLIKYPITDVHWKPVIAHTNPCAVPFKFIAKTETAALDMAYIVQEKLSAIGGPLHERVDPTGLEKAGIRSDGLTTLPLFGMLPDPQEMIERLMSRFYLDMKLFGYSYKIENGTVFGMCDSYEKYNFCC